MTGLKRPPRPLEAVEVEVEVDVAASRLITPPRRLETVDSVSVKSTEVSPLVTSAARVSIGVTKSLAMSRAKA